MDGNGCRWYTCEYPGCNYKKNEGFQKFVNHGFAAHKACPICRVKIDKISDENCLENHLAIYKDRLAARKNSKPNIYQCTICHIEFKNKRKELIKHTLNLHRFCLDCDKDLGSSGPYDHMEDVHGWNVTCDYCGFRSFSIDKKEKGKSHRDNCAQLALKGIIKW